MGRHGFHDLLPRNHTMYLARKGIRKLTEVGQRLYILYEVMVSRSRQRILAAPNPVGARTALYFGSYASM